MRKLIAVVTLTAAAAFVATTVASARPGARMGGTLKVVAWEGYTEKAWVAPSELPAYFGWTLQPDCFSNGATQAFSV